MINADEFKTGDIILFHGIKDCVSKFVEFFSHSEYSHVAVVINRAEFRGMGLDFLADIPTDESDPYKDLFIIESGEEKNPEVEEGKKVLGVQIQKFSDIFDTWEGTIFHRKLTPVNGRSISFYQKFVNIHYDVHGKPYDLILTDWIRVEFNIDIGNKSRRTKTFWCSALTAYIYTRLELLNKDTAWDDVRPKDFGTEFKGRFDKCRLNFINCTLEKEVVIS